MSIDPISLDGMTLALLGSVYQGPQGEQGIPGDDGKAGASGKSVEFQSTSTYIQWRYIGDTTWLNLIPLSAITGPKGDNGDDGAPGTPGTPGTNGTNGTDGQNGEDGRAIQLQKSETHVQWRYVGDTAWVNLIALSELKGEKGDQGQSFSPDVTAGIASRSLYDNEDPGFAFLANDEGMIYFRLDPTGWSEGMAFGKGEKGDKGDTGDTGPAGAKGDKGDKGDTGATGATGAAGKGIASSAVVYQAATSGTVAPTGTWSASPPSVAKGQYLWTRTVITYTDATTSTLYSVAYQGQDGTSGSGGSGDTAFTRAIAPSNVVIQSLNPVTIVSVDLDAASAYHIQFKGTLNDNASSAGLKVCVGSIDKREMALRVSYRDSTGALLTKKILEGGVDNGVTFSGSEVNGPGNLLTIDGYILTGNTNATTPFIVQLCNADAQYDYRQITQGASISAEKMGTVTLS